MGFGNPKGVQHPLPFAFGPYPRIKRRNVSSDAAEPFLSFAVSTNAFINVRGRFVKDVNCHQQCSLFLSHLASSDKCHSHIVRAAFVIGGWVTDGAEALNS